MYKFLEHPSTKASIFLAGTLIAFFLFFLQFAHGYINKDIDLKFDILLQKIEFSNETHRLELKGIDTRLGKIEKKLGL